MENKQTETIEVEKDFLMQVLKKQTEQGEVIKTINQSISDLTLVFKDLQKNARPNSVFEISFTASISSAMDPQFLLQELRPILVKYGVVSLTINKIQ